MHAITHICWQRRCSNCHDRYAIRAQKCDGFRYERIKMRDRASRTATPPRLPPFPYSRDGTWLSCDCQRENHVTATSRTGLGISVKIPVATAKVEDDFDRFSREIFPPSREFSFSPPSRRKMARDEKLFSSALRLTARNEFSIDNPRARSWRLKPSRKVYSVSEKTHAEFTSRFLRRGIFGGFLERS